MFCFRGTVYGGSGQQFPFLHARRVTADITLTTEGASTDFAYPRRLHRRRCELYILFKFLFVLNNFIYLSNDAVLSGEGMDSREWFCYVSSPVERTEETRGMCVYGWERTLFLDSVKLPLRRSSHRGWELTLPTTYNAWESELDLRRTKALSPSISV